MPLLTCFRCRIRLAGGYYTIPHYTMASLCAFLADLCSRHLVPSFHRATAISLSISPLRDPETKKRPTNTIPSGTVHLVPGVGGIPAFFPNLLSYPLQASMMVVVLSVFIATQECHTVCLVKGGKQRWQIREGDGGMI